MDAPQPDPRPRLIDCMITRDEAEGGATRNSHIQHPQLP